MNTARTDIFYSPHRIRVTAEGSTATLEVRLMVMPLYGPEELFDCEPVLAVSAPIDTTVKRG